MSICELWDFWFRVIEYLSDRDKLRFFSTCQDAWQMRLKTKFRSLQRVEKIRSLSSFHRFENIMADNNYTDIYPDSMRKLYFTMRTNVDKKNYRIYALPNTHWGHLIQLRHLEIVCHTVRDSFDIEYLPPQLRVLNLGGYFCGEIRYAIPPSLQCLRCNTETFLKLRLSDLVNLRKFCCVVNSASQISKIFFDALSKLNLSQMTMENTSNLYRLKFPLGRIHPEIKKISLSGLFSFQISDFDKASFRKLKVLILECDKSCITDEISNMPSLQKLCFGGKINVSFIPTGLTHLKCQILECQTSSVTLQHIVYLEIKRYMSNTALDIDYMPNLETLRIDKCSTIQGLDRHQKLIHLDIQKSATHFYKFPITLQIYKNHNVQDLRPECLNLPHGLQQLSLFRLQAPKMFSNQPLKLPDTITYLDIMSDYDIDIIFPAGLKILHMQPTLVSTLAKGRTNITQLQKLYLFNYYRRYQYESDSDSDSEFQNQLNNLSDHEFDVESKIEVPPYHNTKPKHTMTYPELHEFVPHNTGRIIIHTEDTIPITRTHFPVYLWSFDLSKQDKDFTNLFPEFDF